MRYGRNCQHEFVDASTGAAVAPIVNVFAAPGTTTCMTLGRKYRCLHCERVHDLRHRAQLPLPEVTVDTRSREPVAANDARQDPYTPAPRRREIREASGIGR